MAPTQIDRETLALLKSALRTIWPDVGSSHADEALASCLGFKTYASLLAEMPADSAMKVETSPQQLIDRLAALGRQVRPADVDRMLRLFQAEMMGRIGERFRHMAEMSANDNIGTGD